MADAQPLKATFFAFHKREKGGLLLGASITFAVSMIVLFVGFAVMVGLLMGTNPFMMNPKAAADPQTLAAMVTPGRIFTMLAAEFVFLFLIFVLLAAYEAACLRWMIRGEKGGLFGLSLNADTWRVYGGYWLWLIFVFVGYLVFAALILAFAFVGRMLGEQPQAVQIAWGIFSAILCLCLPFYVLVRTAPAAAVSVGTRRFAFFDSWKVTKGRFWALFGSFFLLWLVYLIVAIGLWLAVFGSMFAGLIQTGMTPGNAPAAAEQLNSAMMAMMSNPQTMVLYWGVQFVGLIVALVFYVLNYGVNARAVIAAAEDGKIDGVSTATVANTFS